MPAQQGSINLQGKAAFVAIALPVSALKNVDHNHDGRLSVQEASLFQAAIAEQVSAALQLSDGTHLAKLDFIQINAESSSEHANAVGVDHAMGEKFFLALLKFSFENEPEHIVLNLTFFGSSAEEKQVTIKAIRGATSEVGILTPSLTNHVFFQTPQATLVSFIKIGIEHILSGWDHLAFLLSILCIATQWRQLLAFTGIFTIAHSISLVLALGGLLHFDARWVEPSIALSIIVMAGLNLSKHQMRLSRKLIVVFFFGLLHGLGFAASLGVLDSSATHRIWSIMGFNLGIELGQIAFLATCLSVLAAVRFVAEKRGKQQSIQAFLFKLVNGSALALGSYFLLLNLSH
ncbi:HupE/UreJ family protein [Undibacterium cyanobacteriorum]|uniref:HupE/UreJ family protein n=1 Tax=Undibacterium cyanobacteriorum TaxID=3073561 RepID=A0ABY9RH21_9BURK|nr:HupE/UreJ family protein [Undibacterium sp. 20NA77.5]WMW80526.1 HupE/UreJ family protein [Undibacterium sp. 20NA77.5]